MSLAALWAQAERNTLRRGSETKQAGIREDLGRRIIGLLSRLGIGAAGQVDKATTALGGRLAGRPQAANKVYGLGRRLAEGLGGASLKLPGAAEPYLRHVGTGALAGAGLGAAGLGYALAPDAKAAAAPIEQHAVAPLSAKTAISEFIVRHKYKPEKNPLTTDEQATLERLRAGMSPSRARVVDARRRGREELRRMLANTPLWK